MDTRILMKHSISTAITPLLALVLLVPCSVSAESVTAEFEATVTSIDDDSQMLGDPAELPTTLTGTYRYERDAVDLYDDDPPLRGWDQAK